MLNQVLRKECPPCRDISWGEFALQSGLNPRPTDLLGIGLISRHGALWVLERQFSARRSQQGLPKPQGDNG